MCGAVLENQNIPSTNCKLRTLLSRRMPYEEGLLLLVVSPVNFALFRPSDIFFDRTARSSSGWLKSAKICALVTGNFVSD